MAKALSAILVVLGLSANFAFAQSFTDFKSSQQQVVVFPTVQVAQWYRDWVVRHYLADVPKGTIAVRVLAGDTLVADMRMDSSLARFRYLTDENECKHKPHDGMFLTERPADVVVYRDGTKVEVGLLDYVFSIFAFVCIDSSEYYNGSNPTPRWSFGRPATAELQAQLQAIVDRLPADVKRRVARYGLAKVPAFDFDEDAEPAPTAPRVFQKKEAGWLFRWSKATTDTTETAWIVASDSSHADSVRAEFSLEFNQQDTTMIDYQIDLSYFGEVSSTVSFLFKEKPNAGGVAIFADGKELPKNDLWGAAYLLRIIFGEDLPAGKSGHINSFNFEQVMFPFRKKN